MAGRSSAAAKEAGNVIRRSTASNHPQRRVSLCQGGYGNSARPFRSTANGLTDQAATASRRTICRCDALALLTRESASRGRSPGRGRCIRRPAASSVRSGRARADRSGYARTSNERPRLRRGGDSPMLARRALERGVWHRTGAMSRLSWKRKLARRRADAALLWNITPYLISMTRRSGCQEKTM